MVGSKGGWVKEVVESRRLGSGLIEFNKTRWSCPRNSDQNYTKLCQGMVGSRGWWGLGLV